jgi:dihydropteroate synthase
LLPEGRTAVMWILNVTPDSFYDGGRHASPDTALARARVLLAEGADVIDVGGESSRPGSRSISADEECSRVIPVITGLRRETDRLVSVDTMKAEVAAEALANGADVVNDISAGRFDPAMLTLVATHGAGIVLMHMQGTPATMQAAPRYGDVLAEVHAFLRERAELACAAGINPEQIWLDPGIGFGKSREDNFALLAQLDRLAAIGFSILVGASRKQFLAMEENEPTEDRLAASLAAAALAVAHGAAIVRVHDVAATRHAVGVADGLTRATRRTA